MKTIQLCLSALVVAGVATSQAAIPELLSAACGNQRSVHHHCKHHPSAGDMAQDEPAAEAGATQFRTYGGNVSRFVTDLDVFAGAGQHRLVMSRVYNSRLRHVNQGFGEGPSWLHTYGWIFDDDGTDPVSGRPQIKVRFPDGEDLPFKRVTDDPATNVWRTIQGFGVWIIQSSPTNFALHTHDGWTYDFLRLPAGDYRFVSFEDPEQVSYTLTYNAAGRLTRVSEPTGRYLAFTWASLVQAPATNHIWVISKVATDDGRWVKYSYDNRLYDGGPAVDTCLTGADYSDGTSASYDYGKVGDHPEHLLVEARDVRGEGVAQHVKYQYWDRSLVCGIVHREFNGKTGEKICEFGGYSDNAYNTNEVVNGVVYANGAVRSHAFAGAAHDSDYGGKMLWQTDTMGHKTRYTYVNGGRGFLASETDALGRSTVYQRDSLGRVLRRTNPDRSFERWVYDSYGHVLRHDDTLRRLTANTYDSSGRLVCSLQPDGTFEGYAYNDYGMMTARTNRNGSVEYWFYGSAGLLKYHTNALGQITAYTYWPSGLKKTVTDALGHTTKCFYNERGQIVSIANPDNSVRTFTYDARGNKVAEVNELGAVWQWTYDEFNRKTAATDPLGHVTAWSYDYLTPSGGSCGCANTQDKPSVVISPEGRTTAFYYDCEWRLISKIAAYATPEASITSYVYDSAGNMVTNIDPRGYAWVSTYDSRNRLASSTDPLGHSTYLTYDSEGNTLTERQPGGGMTTNSYDIMNRLVATRDPAGHVTQMSYDNSGNVTALTDANGNVTHWSYDLLNRQTAKTYADGTSEGYGYDAAGSMTSFTGAAGQVMTTVYDSRNRPISHSWNDGLTPAVVKVYDPVGRLTNLLSQAVAGTPAVNCAYTYDAANQLLSESSQIAGGVIRVVSYTHTADGLRQTLGYPSGNSLSNSFTALGLVKDIYANGPPPVASFSYDGAGNRLQATLNNGLTSGYLWDEANRLTQLTHSASGATVASFGYTYDSLNQRTSLRREDGRTEKYTYDPSRQLTSADYDDGASELFSYDPMGNLLNRTNLSASADTFLPNNLNQYVSLNGNAMRYDSKGNLLSWTGGTYTWDAWNRLVGVTRETNVMACVYDGRSRCVRRTINGVTTDYVYDDWNLVAECQNDTVVAEYIHGPMVDETLARTTASNTVYYCGDALNSIAALTDSRGRVLESYRYTAFGQPSVFDGEGNTLSASASGNRFAFQGREWFAEVNLTDHRNRYYSPEIQRWLSRDPLHERGGLNLYASVNNNTLNFVDPDGRGIVNCVRALAKLGKAAAKVANRCLDIRDDVLSTGLDAGHVDSLDQSLNNLNDAYRLVAQHCGCNKAAVAAALASAAGIIQQALEYLEQVAADPEVQELIEALEAAG